MNLTPQAQHLVARARVLAQESCSWRCNVVHLLWAIVEHEPGEEARRLRSSCKHAMGSLVRRPEELPPLDEAVVEMLAADSVPTDPTALMDLVCHSTLPSHVRDSLVAWQSSKEPRDSGPKEPEETAEPNVSWIRLEYSKGRTILVLDLVRDGATVHARKMEVGARRRALQGEITVETATLKSEKNAERSLQRRIDTALDQGYARVESVLLPLPLASSRDLRRQEQELLRAERQERMERFEDDVLRFFRAWAALGHDPERTFHQEAQALFQTGRAPRGAWNDLAKSCVALATEHFGVRFLHRTEIDEEHGTIGDVASHRFADFYVSPSHVARLAFDKTRLGDGRVDGYFPEWRASSDPLPEPDDEVRRARKRFRDTLG